MESQYVAQEVADVDDGIHKNVSPFPTRVILRITGHDDVLIAVSNWVRESSLSCGLFIWLISAFSKLQNTDILVSLST